MTTLGLIGSGHIGSTVARLAVDAGHEVVLSNSRGPQSLGELVAALGPRAQAATGEEAAAAGDLVLVSLPVKAYPSVPALALAGKTVLDTGNYYPERDGHITELDDQSLTHSENLSRPVTAFLDSLGYDVIDGGPLAEGWRQQPGTPAYGTPYGSFDDERGVPAGETAISAALAAATR